MTMTCSIHRAFELEFWDPIKIKVPLNILVCLLYKRVNQPLISKTSNL